jgi:hypothetical protein
LLFDSALELDAKLGATRRAFRAALVSASEQLRSLLESEVDHEELSGQFQNGCVDASSFGALFQPRGQDTAEQLRIREARNVLVELLEMGDDLYRVRVSPGASVHKAVGQAFGRIGRAFSAAHSASLAKAGAPTPPDEADRLARYDFHHWSLAERALCPGLLIEVLGEDLFVDGLSEFLDGNCCLGFQVRGECSPVPLIGLVRPGVFVAQSKSTAPFGIPDRGPAIVAVLPEAEAAATFTHRPAGPGESGVGIWSRLAVESLPEKAPEAPIGGKSANQQRDELRQLAALSIGPIAARQESDAAPSTMDTVASEAPVDSLAAWLSFRPK